MPWVEANGVSLRYESAGSGPPIVMLHEMGGSLESWDEVASVLRTHYRTVRYDQRGAGWSEKVRRPFAFEELIDDFDAIAAALGVDGPFGVIGVAAGALQAACVAVRHPERVASVVLCNPSIGMDAARAAALVARAADAERDGMRAVLARALDAALPPGSVAGAGVYDRYRARYLANDPWCFAAMHRALAAFDPAGIVERIRCPALVVTGRDDRVRPAAETAAIAAAIAGARQAVIPGGHFLPVQSPGPLGAALAAFLA
jgi:3-oxoadipate enol-lactonase